MLYLFFNLTMMVTTTIIMAMMMTTMMMMMRLILLMMRMQMMTMMITHLYINLIERPSVDLTVHLTRGLNSLKFGCQSD